MEWTEVLALPHEDQVTVMLGLVVREAVTVDAAAREAWATLKGTDPSVVWDGPPSFSGAIRLCRKALAEDQIEAGLVPLGTLALDFAESAYSERNRFVHDELVGDAQGIWSRVRLHRGRADRPARDEVSIDDLRHCYLDLVRAGWRLRALHHFIQWQRAAPSGDRDFERVHWALILSDDFEVQWGGSIQWSPLVGW